MSSWVVVEIKWNGAMGHEADQTIESYLPHLYPQGKRTPLM